MRTVVVTPPAVPLVSWEEARAHLRREADDEQQAFVMGLVAAASGHIDGPAGWLGRAIGVQTLEARIDAWDDPTIRLPYPPVIGITSITYTDPAGTEQTAAAFELFGTDLLPAWGTVWPTARAGREAIRVRYQAGYTALPYAIRAAILLMVGDLWANRDTTAAGIVSAVPMSTTVEALLAPFRAFA